MLDANLSRRRRRFDRRARAHLRRGGLCRRFAVHLSPSRGAPAQRDRAARAHHHAHAVASSLSRAELDDRIQACLRALPQVPQRESQLAACLLAEEKDLCRVVPVLGPVAVVDVRIFVVRVWPGHRHGVATLVSLIRPRNAQPRAAAVV